MNMLQRFFGLLLVFCVFCDAKSCTLEKLKSFKVPESDELCKQQFDIFLESLRNREKWASESKLDFTSSFNIISRQ